MRTHKTFPWFGISGANPPAQTAVLPLLLVFALCFLAWPASGVTRSWTGSGGNNFWSTPGNWNPAGAPQNGDVLRLEAMAISTNDLVNLRLHELWCFARFAIRGNGFTVTNGINANLNSILTVAVPITLARNQEFKSVNAPGATMTLGGGLNLNGFDLTLNLATSSGGIFITNVISGVGNIRVVQDYAQTPNVCTVGLGSPGINNTFAGTVTLDSGTLRLRGDEPLGTGGIIINSGLLSLHDARSTRPLVFGRGFSITTSGLCQWSGPISLPTSGNLLAYLESSNRFVISGPISGPTNGSLAFVGSEIELSGSAIDTFTGHAEARCDLLLLNKSGGTHIGARQLGIYSGSEVRWMAPNQLAGADVVFTIAGTGLVNLNIFSDTFGAITSRGGSIETTTGQLTVNGPVTQLGTPHSVSPTFISGNLYLPSGFRTFEVQYSSSSFNNLVIAADIHGPGSLQKTGAGTLWLSGASDYTGLTLVNEGILVAGANGALGAASAGTAVQDGATLALKTVGGILAEPIYLRGDGVGGTNGALNVDATLTVTLRNQFPSIYACLDLTTNATIRVEPSARLTTDGFISGIGPLKKTGPGTLVFSNANANTYTGDTVVSQGTLELRKPNNTNSVPGNLTIGPASAASPAVARWFQAGAMSQNAVVTVNAESLLDLNGHNQTLATLNLNDGGDVQTGTGQLIFTAGGVVTVGTLNAPQVGLLASSSITGKIGLPVLDYLTFNVGGYGAAPLGSDAELVIPAIISGGGNIIKNGAGTLQLSGANTFNDSPPYAAGDLYIYGGIVIASSSSALGGTAGWTLVYNGARLSLVGNISINNETLYLNSTNSAALDNLGGSNTWTGPITLARDSRISVNQDWSLTVPGVVAGSGALIKRGAGLLQLSGSANNTHSGNTHVDAGTLLLAKPAFFQAVPHDLIVGSGQPGASATLVRYLNQDQVWNRITVNGNGLLDLNGYDEYSGDLTLNEGGDVQTGSGTYYLANNANLVVNPGAANNSATITGRLGLFPGQHQFIVNNGVTTPGLFDLNIPATMLQSSTTAGFIKTGTGRMRLAGTNTYTGLSYISSGLLHVDGVQPQSTVEMDHETSLRGSGTVGHILFNGGSLLVAPGNSAGFLTCSNFDASGGSGTLEMELNGHPTGYDQIVARGLVDLRGLALQSSLNFASSAGQQFTLINNDGADAVTGTFTGLPQNKKLYVGQELFQISYTGGTGNDVVLTRLVTPPRPTLTIQQVPPGSVRLVWPTNDPPFRLQSHTNLATSDWLTASPLLVILGTNNVVTNAVSGGAKFYRLVHP